MPNPDTPDPFSRNDRPIYDIYVASRASAALAVAVRLGIFRIVADRPRPIEHLTRVLQIDRRPLDAVLTALVGMGLLRRKGDGVDGPLAEGAAVLYEPTLLARDHLLPDSPFYLGGLIDLENEHFVTPANLIDAMRKNRPQVYEGKDPWEVIEAEPDAAADFTRAMHSISVRPAFGLATSFDFSSVRSLLDVGGGSGILAIAAALKHPDLRATVLDLPAVAAVARETVDAYQVGDRVSIVTGNMFTGLLPAGHDAILFSQILHDWPPDRGRDLIRKAYDALPPGGVVLIHEKLLNDRRDGPLANALVSIDMLFWTEGQQYSASELHRMLAEGGFAEPQTRPTVGYWSITWARKGSSG